MTEETGEKRHKDVYLPPRPRPAVGPSPDKKGWGIGGGGEIPAMPMWTWDFYGAPAWSFWLGCVAIGAIVGIILHA